MIVWIASYPRSGSTFIRVILNSIFNIKTHSIYDDKFDIGADGKTSKVVGHEFLPDDFDVQKIRADKEPFYLKTHELPDSRISESDKVIYLIRDGRDSVLSFTKYLNTFFMKDKGTIDVINGDTVVGAWGDHVAAWNPKEKSNTLLIRFERLVQNPSSFIEKIGDFLNLKPNSGTIPTFSELHEINPQFFRSGKLNSWEDSFTEEEVNAFWEKNYTQMIEYGYTYKVPAKFQSNTNFSW
jgi:hypothetical protein